MASATRFSLIVALLATIGLIALGATSLDAAVARMGAKGWKRLHNIIYACAAAISWAMDAKFQNCNAK
jgi:methionine sulfoxide reductase heme-binding subunit